MQLDTQKAHRAFGGTQGYYRHQSAVTGTPMDFAVYTPDPSRHSGPWPVVWFLSGLTCTPDNFVVKAGAQRIAAELGLCIVAPDTSPRGVDIEGDSQHYWFGKSASYYLDASAEPWSSHYRMFSYLSEELPQIVEANFSVDLERQAISGHSMGGHGALLMALKHPGRFKRVSALAPISSFTRCPWGETVVERFFGGDLALAEAYDPVRLLERGETLPRTLIDQGSSDQFLTEQLRTPLLSAALEARGVKHNLRMQPGYDHSYFFVATFCEEHLRFLAEALV
ncbi:MAG: S-formylglutathione hydrolase [Polyangiaceae bacterium]